MTTKVEIEFDNKQKKTYDCDLDVNGEYGSAVKAAINHLFERVKKGMYHRGPYDHRVHPYREPGPKATKIIRIWVE